MEIDIILALGLMLMVALLEWIPCGELKDKNNGDIKKLSCMDRLAIWLDRKDIL